MSRFGARLADTGSRRTSGDDGRNPRRSRSKPARRNDGASGPPKMKRSPKAEQPVSPLKRVVPVWVWERLPGLALLTYAIAWLAALASFIKV